MAFLKTQHKKSFLQGCSELFSLANFQPEWISACLLPSYNCGKWLIFLESWLSAGHNSLKLPPNRNSLNLFIFIFSLFIFLKRQIFTFLKNFRCHRIVFSYGKRSLRIKKKSIMFFIVRYEIQRKRCMELICTG